ncbi:MAG TPA: hypothetical protein VHZ95_07385, partial [Polyangiales bacterium]|nr:hypothetical protein [Polyangiales bacterium]
MGGDGRSRSFIARILLVSFGCLLALAGSECGLRVFGYAGDVERDRRVFDPRYGAVPKDSWIWTFQIDEAKHRAVELAGRVIPLAKAKDETRVLFVGDSATEGAFVSATENFPSVF